MTDRKTYHYRYLVDGDSLECTSDFTSGWPVSNSDLVAEDAAEEYDNNSNWPNRDYDGVQFTILLPDGTFVGKFKVHRDFSPTFYATEIK